jgi:hypothetical protein
MVGNRISNEIQESECIHFTRRRTCLRCISSCIFWIAEPYNWFGRSEAEKRGFNFPLFFDPVASPRLVNPFEEAEIPTQDLLVRSWSWHAEVT